MAFNPNAIILKCNEFGNFDLTNGLAYVRRSMVTYGVFKLDNNIVYDENDFCVTITNEFTRECHVIPLESSNKLNKYLHENGSNKLHLHVLSTKNDRIDKFLLTCD